MINPLQSSINGGRRIFLTTLRRRFCSKRRNFEALEGRTLRLTLGRLDA
jgi:hypothetical protein